MSAFACYTLFRKCIELQEQNKQLKESIKELKKYLKLVEEHKYINFIVLDENETHIFD